jgi:hypothetical protein
VSITEPRDDSKARPIIGELAALGFEVELDDSDAEAITHTMQ